MSKYNVVDRQQTALRVLLFGESGRGKTTIATSGHGTEGLGDTLVIDIDQGVSAVSWRDGLLVYGGKDFSSMKPVLSDLALPRDRRPEELKNVGVVVVDSLTAFSEDTLDEMVQQSKRKSGRSRDEFLREWQDYGRMTNALRYFVAQLNMVSRTSNIMVVYTAGERQTDVGGVIETTPELTPKLARHLKYMVDCQWYTRRISNKYYLQVEDRNDGVATKTRDPYFHQALLDWSERTAPEGKGDKYRGLIQVESPFDTTLETVYNLYVNSYEKENN